MEQKVFILGASGNVGRELVSQILEKDTKFTHVNPSKIIGVTNSNKYIFDSRGIENNILMELRKGKKEANDVFEKFGAKMDNLHFLLELVKQEGLDGEVVFADVTAGKKELLEFHKALIGETQNFLVTANKNPISLFSMDYFEYLTSYKGRYDTNTTVMGGGGILNFVDERADKILDNILEIKGMFSGTLGYIMSELEKGEKSFSLIVREAKEKGYTEPNPWDDLNGLDVARKLIILARYAGYNVELEDVEVLPLINEKYSAYSDEEFLEAIKKEDNYFEKKVLELIEKGEVLRYIGEMKIENKGVKLKVGLINVSKNSDLGTLSGTSNIAIIETEILKNPLLHVIKSRGAGLAVTAGSVRIGIAKMLPNYVRTR